MAAHRTGDGHAIDEDLGLEVEQGSSEGEGSDQRGKIAQHEELVQLTYEGRYILNYNTVLPSSTAK